jgi:peptidoglycan hydrolase-like protein with peptidoglycan-binding domain
MTSESTQTGAIGLREGSEGESVRTLQHYLRHYGYLGRTVATAGIFETDDTMSSDFVDHDEEQAIDGVMDRPTCDALGRFQEFAGLEATREVDEATLAALNTRRCGVSDLADYTTGAGKWSTNNLTYSFQNYTRDLPSSTINWAIDQAFALWSAETP